MYEIQLYGRRILYFKYAPPLTNLDDTSSDELPNPPFKGAAPYQRSVYYYWWAFLRENQNYIDCCEANGVGPLATLYRDFGDIRDDNFMRWWADTGRNLFCEPIDRKIEIISGDQIGPQYFDNVNLSVPITGDLDRTLAEIRKLLSPIYRKSRLHSGNISHAKYQVFSKPVLTSLHNHLMVYQAQKQFPRSSKMELAQIALSKGALINSDETGLDLNIERNINRYLTQAKTIIANVALGRFPDNGPRGQPDRL
jgi:hypothetical protein